MAGCLLVERRSAKAGVFSEPGRAQYWCDVGLTESGGQLVQAWKAGDREQLAAVLSELRPV